MTNTPDRLHTSAYNGGIGDDEQRWLMAEDVFADLAEVYAFNDLEMEQFDAVQLFGIDTALNVDEKTLMRYKGRPLEERQDLAFFDGGWVVTTVREFNKRYSVDG